MKLKLCWKKYGLHLCAPKNLMEMSRSVQLKNTQKPMVQRKCIHFSEWSVAERSKMDAPRGGQAAGCVFFFAHSLYAAGGNPPGLTVVILIRL